MLVKVWKCYTTRELRKKAKYVQNPAKTIKTKDRNTDKELMMAGSCDAEKLSAEIAELVVEANAKWVTGYLCGVDNTADEWCTKAALLDLKTGVQGGIDNGVQAYHILQIFPPWLDITDEEMHQCGVDLAKKMGGFPALIASHVHPVLDSIGRARGKIRHNHLLVSAYVDPHYCVDGPGKFPNDFSSKYWLRCLNDLVAVEHGLPIVRAPEKAGRVTYLESLLRETGESWKENLRRDIEWARDWAINWKDFKGLMADMGYRVVSTDHGRAAKYVTADDREICDSTLGRHYTKEAIKGYWQCLDREPTYKYAIKKTKQQCSEPLLSDFAAKSGYKLYVRVPLPYTHINVPSYAMLPLQDTPGDVPAWVTYFEAREKYAVCDATGIEITKASGHEIVQTLIDLRDVHGMAVRDNVDMALYDFTRLREERLIREAQEANQEAELALERARAAHTAKLPRSESGYAHRCALYDTDGRRRSLIELVFALLLVIVTKEAYVWVDRNEYPRDHTHDVYYAKHDDMLQMIYDIDTLVREEQLTCPEDAFRQYDIAKGNYNRSQTLHAKAKKAVEQKKRLWSAVCVYDSLRKKMEEIEAMPESAEKEQVMAENAEKIRDYQIARDVVRANGIITDAQIIQIMQDFARAKSDERDWAKCEAVDAIRYRNLTRICRGLILAEDKIAEYDQLQNSGVDDHLSRAIRHEQVTKDKHGLEKAVADAAFVTENQYPGVANEISNTREIAKRKLYRRD